MDASSAGPAAGVAARPRHGSGAALRVGRAVRRGLVRIDRDDALRRTGAAQPGGCPRTADVGHRELVRPVVAGLPVAVVVDVAAGRTAVRGRLDARRLAAVRAGHHDLRPTGTTVRPAGPRGPLLGRRLATPPGQHHARRPATAGRHHDRRPATARRRPTTRPGRHHPLRSATARRRPTTRPGRHHPLRSAIAGRRPPPRSATAGWRWGAAVRGGHHGATIARYPRAARRALRGGHHGEAAAIARRSEAARRALRGQLDGQRPAPVRGRRCSVHAGTCRHEHPATPRDRIDAARSVPLSRRMDAGRFAPLPYRRVRHRRSGAHAAAPPRRYDAGRPSACTDRKTSRRDASPGHGAAAEARHPAHAQRMGARPAPGDRDGRRRRLGADTRHSGVAAPTAAAAARPCNGRCSVANASARATARSPPSGGATPPGGSRART